jgi:hypothetical protein
MRCPRKFRTWPEKIISYGWVIPAIPRCDSSPSKAKFGRYEWEIINRALAEVEGQQVTWIWIGHHSEYDRLIR